jgi:hypothetical protein
MRCIPGEAEFSRSAPACGRLFPTICRAQWQGEHAARERSVPPRLVGPRWRARRAGAA